MVFSLGVDFTDIVVSVRGTKVKLRIWLVIVIIIAEYRLILYNRDTAGQEKFHTFTKQFFRGTQVWRS